MLFTTSTNFTTNLRPEEVRNVLVGKRTDIKQLNFEIKEYDGIIKIIPHTENDEKSRIVPITHVEVSADANGTNVRMNTKPRRIDLGGLYLAAGAIILIALIAVYLRITYPEQSIWVSGIIMGVALLSFIIFRLRLESSYYSYVKSLRSFVKGMIK